MFKILIPLILMLFYSSVNAREDIKDDKKRKYKLADWRNDKESCVTRKRTGDFANYLVQVYKPECKRRIRWVIRKLGEPDRRTIQELPDAKIDAYYYYYSSNCGGMESYCILTIFFRNGISYDFDQTCVGG